MVCVCCLAIFAIHVIFTNAPSEQIFDFKESRKKHSCREILLTALKERDFLKDRIKSDLPFVFLSDRVRLPRFFLFCFQRNKIK